MIEFMLGILIGSILISGIILSYHLLGIKEHHREIAGQLGTIDYHISRLANILAETNMNMAASNPSYFIKKRDKTTKQYDPKTG